MRRTAFVERLAQFGEADALGDHHAVDRLGGRLQQELRHADAEGAQGVADVAGGGDVRLDQDVRGSHLGAAGLADDGREKLVLGGEMRVERRLGHAGLAGDRIHADRAVALRHEQRRGRVQHGMALRRLGFQDSAHGSWLN
jgi:hypothetical protein